MSGLCAVVRYFVFTLSVLLLISLGRPGLCRADAKMASIHVLAIDSDDADEQADALTAALRSRARESSSFKLLEAPQSLSMLMAAFRCPQKPDATCLQKIGDKLGADQFVWGTMTKGPGHQVMAEVHLWRRGKEDVIAREGYSDNLKDSNDDALKRIAAQIFGKLVGTAGGTLVVRANSQSGTVIVDGETRTPLDHGHVTLTLTAGPHVIDVQAAGFVSAHREVTIQPSITSALEVALEAEAGAPVIVVAGPSQPLPIRAIVGWSSIAVGGVLIVTGAILGANYLSDQSDLNSARQNNYQTNSNVAVTDPCHPSTTTPETVRGCNALSSAHGAEAGEITTFAVGGVLAAVGIYLVVTDHPSAAASAPPPPAKTGLGSVHFLPSVGPGSGSLLVLGRF